MALPGARTGTRPGPTTAPTPGPRRCWSGAAIAIGLTLWREGSQRRWFTRFASVLAVAGVGGHGRAVVHDGGDDRPSPSAAGSSWPAWPAGAVVLGCAVAPRSLVVRLLELPPLPQWGRISYGVYLWYWPVLLVLTGQRLHWGVYPLFLARVGHHGRHRRHQLRPRRDADPPGRAAAVALLGGRAHRRGRRHQRGLRQHAGAGRGDACSQGSQLARRRRRRPRRRTTTTSGDAGRPWRADAAAPDDRPRRRPPVPSYLSPALPAATTAKPVKVLLVGDSVAGSLGVGLAEEAKQYNVQIANEGTPGCSLSMQTEIKVLFYTVAPERALRRRQQPGLAARHLAQVGGRLQPRRRRLRRARRDLRPGGRRASGRTWGSPSFDTLPRRAASARRSPCSGPRAPAVVLATTPYYDSGTSPTGTPWPEDDPARVHARQRHHARRGRHHAGGCATGAGSTSST